MSLILSDLVVEYPDPSGGIRRVLDVPRFELELGTQACLVGGSGSGKTTLLNVISGITLPTSGKVLHGDTDIAGLPEAARDRFRARRIGIVFQTFNLLQGLSAIENVALAGSLAGLPIRDARVRARELLVRVGLQGQLDSRPARMSVGEQQRTSIARAVMTRPELILADEPTANLDPENGRAVIDLLREVAEESSAQLLLVTHEPEVKARFERVLPIGELAA